MIHCSECEDGFVWAYSKTIKCSPFAFRCSCSAGQFVKQQAIRPWTPRRLKDYVPFYLSKDDLDEHYIADKMRTGDIQDEKYVQLKQLWGNARFELVQGSIKVERTRLKNFGLEKQENPSKPEESTGLEQSGIKSKGFVPSNLMKQLDSSTLEE